MNPTSVAIRAFFWLCVVAVLFGGYVSGRSILEDRATNGASLAMLYFPLTMGATIAFAVVAILVRFAAGNHLGQLEKLAGVLLTLILFPVAIASLAMMERN